jgi:CheY-like chemotaxis protein
MEGRTGLLEIRLRDVGYDRESAEQHAGLASGLYLQLIISDTGSGMSPEVQQHIFEPFFTTKEPGRGTGMGLAVVHGIISRLGGSIRVYSEEGRGTTFMINLPALPAQDAAAAYSEPASLPHGSGRLLLVDDEPAIVRLLARMLDQLGYSVTACDNSPEAWRIFRQRPQDFDLLITDLTMPRMTGVELARRILEVRPELPVLICTGFGQAVSAEQARQLGVAGYLLKPISRSDLAHEVQRQLAQSAQRSPAEVAAG